MKKLFTSGIIASGLLAFSPVSSAAIYDFQQWVVDNSEKGFDNAAPFTLTDAGLTLTATAFEATGAASNVYMDGAFNGIIGGMGVCSTLTNTAQCDPSSDDNVSVGEILSWEFSQGVNSLTLGFGNDSHYDYANRDIQYSRDAGVTWLTATTDGSAMLTLSLLGGAGVDFKTIDTSHNGVENQFYIRTADVTVVPVPAAVWLFGSGLIGLAGFMRRRR